MAASFACSLLSCASQPRLYFTCQDPTVGIYVDDEYVGTSYVKYTFRHGVKSVVVKGISEGQEVFSRTIYKESWNSGETIDFPVQPDYQYSTEK